MSPRPRYWEEWEAYSKARKNAVIVYKHNRLVWAARSRDSSRPDPTYWPGECLWYYLGGVRHTVMIYWHSINHYRDKGGHTADTETLDPSLIPRNVQRVVSKVQAVLSEKITQADRDRWAEMQAREREMLAWYDNWAKEHPEASCPPTSSADTST